MDKFNRRIVTFYEGATKTRDRRYLQRADYDSAVTLNNYTRREALSVARWAYANEGFTRGAVDAMARYSVGDGIVPMAQTYDEEWNAIAEEYWTQASKVLDVTGRFTLAEMLSLISRAIDVDGDIGVVLTKAASGFPQIQVVEAHRIGAPLADLMGDGSDGVITNAFGRPVAYRVAVKGDSDLSQNYKVIPASDFILIGEATRPDQLRCITNLIHALRNIQDLKEIYDLEKHATKTSLAPALVQKSDSTDDLLSPNQTLQTEGPIKREELYGGLIVRMGREDELISFDSNRPTTGLDIFARELIRPVALGMGLPLEFVHSPEKLSGSGSRLVVAQAARRMKERQSLLVNRLLNRLYGYVIAVGIKRKDLPPNDEWWRVGWQGPQSITVDNGRDSAANRDDVRAGLRTYAEDYGERGRDWQSELIQKAKEARFIRNLAEQYGLESSEIASMSPNPTAPTTEPESEDSTEDDDETTASS